jgi:hypothetical protein
MEMKNKSKEIMRTKRRTLVRMMTLMERRKSFLR